MKNIKMCILKEGIPRKERKTERKERKEKKMKFKKKKNRMLLSITLHSISFCNNIFVPYEN